MKVYRIEKDGCGPYKADDTTIVCDFYDITEKVNKHLSKVERNLNLRHVAKRLKVKGTDKLGFGCSSIKQLLHYIGPDALHACKLCNYDIVMYEIPGGVVYPEKYQVVYPRKYQVKGKVVSRVPSRAIINKPMFSIVFDKVVLALIMMYKLETFITKQIKKQYKETTI